MTDLEIEQGWLESSERVLAAADFARLRSALEEHFGELHHAFVIYWIPEQGEDIYEVIVDPSLLTSVEVPRELSAPILVNDMPLRDYLRGPLTKERRMKVQAVNRLLRGIEKKDRSGPND